MPLDGTLYEDQTLKIINAAQERIRDPLNWCQNVSAVDCKGKEVSYVSPHAVAFCASGAVALSEKDVKGLLATRLLIMAAKQLGYLSEVNLNDACNHEKVMEMFDRARRILIAQIHNREEVMACR